METIKKVFRIYLPWQDEKEENWLRKMDKKGWHLTKYIFCIYFFEKGEPKDYIYKLDYQTNIENMQEYLDIFRDSGWELVTTYANWYYFRTLSKDGKIPEIYTDIPSKLEKYKRLLLVLFLCGLPSFMFLMNSSNYKRLMNTSESYSIILKGIMIFVFFTALLLLYIVIRLFIHIKFLENKNRKIQKMN